MCNMKDGKEKRTKAPYSTCRLCIAAVPVPGRTNSMTAAAVTGFIELEVISSYIGILSRSPHHMLKKTAPSLLTHWQITESSKKKREFQVATYCDMAKQILQFKRSKRQPCKRKTQIARCIKWPHRETGVRITTGLASSYNDLVMDADMQGWCCWVMQCKVQRGKVGNT